MTTPIPSALLAAAALITLSACEEKPTASAPAPDPQGSQSTLGRSRDAGLRAAGSITDAQSAAAGVADAQTGGPAVTVNTVRFTIPEGWNNVPPSNTMRAAEMRVPTDAGECLVTFSTAGGDIQANIDRWAGQFKDDNGQTPTPRRTNRTVSGLPVTEIQLEGTFTDGMSGNPAPRENYSMRGAIIQSPRGLIFVKMTGPTRAMEDSAAGWNSLIGGLYAD